MNDKYFSEILLFCSRESFQKIINFQNNCMRSVKGRRQSTEINQSKLSTFRMSQIIEATQAIRVPRLPFADRRNRILELPSKATIKISTRRTLVHSTRLLRNRTTAMLNIGHLVKIQSSDFASLVSVQLRKGKRRIGQNIVELLRKAFKLSENMNEEVYSYKAVEQKMEVLHETVKQLGSNTLVYRTYAFAGFVFFQYGSYSLSLYYFDRAFKCFYDRDENYYLYEKHLELQLYKAVTRIFLAKTRYPQAKNFAFKFLRKSWLVGDIDQEIAAYDLLGKVYMQLQQISMSRYFHNRMAAGQRESSEIVSMSRQEMGKQSRQKTQFVCYETINIFVDKDAAFNDILQNHYHMRSLEHAKQAGINSDVPQIYIYTHHSPNRQLNNYHLLQRKMIEARHSKEIHFIRPKDCHRIRKIISDFSAILHEVLHGFEGNLLPTQRAEFQLF